MKNFVQKLFGLIVIPALLLAFTTVTPKAQNAFIKAVPTLAALKLVQPDASYPFCHVMGWTAAGDGGGGLYMVAAGSASTNYAVVTSSIDSTKQWTRMAGFIGGTKPPRTQTCTAATSILPEAATIVVTGTGGATVLTNNQTLPSGSVDGQRLTIIGNSDTDTVAISDKAGLTAGGTIQLSTTNIVLGQGDTLTLQYSTITTNWHEISRSNN